MKSSTNWALLAMALMVCVTVAAAQQPSSTQPQSPSMQQPSSTQPQSPSMQKPSSPSQTQTSPTAAQESSSASGVNVNPAQVQKKVGTPPPSTATPTSSVGTSHTKMVTPADSQSWAEQIDADGDGTVDQATLVWDAKDRVLFSSTSGSFTCRNGTPGSGDLLIAVNGTGNKWGRPAGSGFWLASLDKGQCGAQANTLWGCKFDQSGTATVCGAAQLNEQNQDIVIVAADTKQ